MFPKLFSPVRIGGLEIKNRVAMTAMGVNLAAAGAGGDGDIIAFYEARARLNPVLKGRRHLLVVHRSEAGANHVGSVEYCRRRRQSTMTETNEYYRDKIAVVTGGASGIGLALAETMLSYGAKRVVLADVSEANLVLETARLNAAYPGRALGIRCDVTNEEKVKGMIEQAAEFGGGRIDFLFNNAGAGFSGNFDEQTNGDWEKAFALNFYAAVYGIRAVLPVMRAHGGGHIVNIISGIAFYPMAYQTMYSATKAALNSLTLALRYEFWDENIRLTSATPGTTATAIWSAGSVGAPPGAQSPVQSARTILAGVAKNERLVLGDQGDASGARSCFNPDAAKSADDYLLNVARKRRSGEWAV